MAQVRCLTTPTLSRRSRSLSRGLIAILFMAEHLSECTTLRPNSLNMLTLIQDVQGIPALLQLGPGEV
jgi:hypothetical protein